MLSFLSEVLVTNSTVTAVSAQRTVEHAKNVLHNITTGGMTHPVQSLVVNYGQCCPRVAAGPYRPNSPIMQLSPSMTPRLGTVHIIYCEYHPVTKSPKIGCCDHFSNVAND